MFSARASEQRPQSLDDFVTLRANIYLPDSDGVARPMSDLFIGNELPATLRSFGIRRCYTPRRAACAVSPAAWRLKAYTFRSVFPVLRGSSTRRNPQLYAQWLVRHWYPRAERSLREAAVLLPIWPGQDGQYWPLGSSLQSTESKDSP